MTPTTCFGTSTVRTATPFLCLATLLATLPGCSSLDAQRNRSDLPIGSWLESAMSSADARLMSAPTLPPPREVLTPPALELSVRAMGVALDQLVRDLRRDYDLAIEFDQALAAETIDAWFDGQATELLDLVAGQLRAHWRWDGERFLIMPGPEFLLYLPENNRPEDVAQVIGEHFEASATAIGPHVLVTGDSTPAVRHFVNALGTTPARYMVDVLVVELQSSVARELGLGWALGGNAGLGLSAASGSGGAFSYSAEAVLEVVGRVAASSDAARLSNRATLFLVEGEQAAATQGDRIPLARRSVSPEGVVTVVGYDYVQSGFQLQARAVGLPDTSIRLDLVPTLSEVGGLVGGENPVLLERSMTASVVLRSGEWVLIGGFDRTADRSSSSGVAPDTIAGSLTNRSADAAVSLLAVRIHRL